MQNYCRCGPLHVVRVEEMVTGSWGCFTAGAEARPLRCLFLSRVTRAVWKAPVSGSVEPHKCSESGSSPMCTELQAHGNMLKNSEAGEIKPIWWLIRKRRGAALEGAGRLPVVRCRFLGTRTGAVWKWGRGVAGRWISSGKKGVRCGESTRGSGKKTVNTSLTRLFPSFFSADLWPVISQLEEKWELKHGAHIFGGVSPFCTCQPGWDRATGVCGHICTGETLSAVWRLLRLPQGDSWRPGLFSFSSICLLWPPICCLAVPFLHPKWKSVAYQTSFSHSACVSKSSLMS